MLSHEEGCPIIQTPPFFRDSIGHRLDRGHQWWWQSTLATPLHKTNGWWATTTNNSFILWSHIPTYQLPSIHPFPNCTNRGYHPFLLYQCKVWRNMMQRNRAPPLWWFRGRINTIPNPSAHTATRKRLGSSHIHGHGQQEIWPDCRVAQVTEKDTITVIKPWSSGHSQLMCIEIL